MENETREETEMEQVLSDLQGLKRLYGLLHKGPKDENLDEASRALLMKMLDDATQQTLLKQAKMLSGSLMSPVLERKLSTRSDRRTRDTDPPLSPKPPASPRPSLLGGERPSRLNQQYSTVSSRRAGGHIDSRRQAAEEPLLARLASHRSSRTTASALPSRHRPSGEQPNSGLSLYRLPVAATSQHGTVTGSNQRAGLRGRMRRTSDRGDQSSPEGSSRRHSLSRDMSLGQARLHGRGTDRRVGEECSSRTCRGLERAGRGVVLLEQSSSGKTMVTICSRIKPNRGLKDKERSLRRARNKEKEESTPRRGRALASVSSGGWSSSRPPRRTRKRDDSGSMYISSCRSSSGTAISYPSSSPTVSSEPSTSASYSPPPVSRHGIAMPVYASASCSQPPVQGCGIAWPVYAPKMSRSMRRRRREEVLQSRVERLRKLKNKIVTVFHHHYHYGRGKAKEGPSSRRIPRDNHHKSPWQYLGGMFHHMKGQVQKTTKRAVVAVKEKVARQHWWQRRKPRRGKAKMVAGSRPRRRLGLL